MLNVRLEAHSQAHQHRGNCSRSLHPITSCTFSVLTIVNYTTRLLRACQCSVTLLELVAVCSIGIACSSIVRVLQSQRACFLAKDAHAPCGGGPWAYDLLRNLSIRPPDPQSLCVVKTPRTPDQANLGDGIRRPRLPHTMPDRPALWCAMCGPHTLIPPQLLVAIVNYYDGIGVYEYEV